MSGRIGELILILLIILVLFGAGRLPRVMADVGRSIRSLREGVSEGSAPSKGLTKKKNAVPSKKTFPSKHKE